MPKDKIIFSLLVSYEDGIDTDFEDMLAKLLGPHIASGFSFDVSERDLEWSYPSKEEAKAAVEKLTGATIQFHRLAGAVLYEWDKNDEIVSTTTIK